VLGAKLFSFVWVRFQDLLDKRFFVFYRGGGGHGYLSLGFREQGVRENWK